MPADPERMSPGTSPSASQSTVSTPWWHTALVLGAFFAIPAAIWGINHMPVGGDEAPPPASTYNCSVPQPDYGTSPAASVEWRLHCDPVVRGPDGRPVDGIPDPDSEYWDQYNDGSWYEPDSDSFDCPAGPRSC